MPYYFSYLLFGSPFTYCLVFPGVKEVKREKRVENVQLNCPVNHYMWLVQSILVLPVSQNLKTKVSRVQCSVLGLLGAIKANQNNQIKDKKASQNNQ